MKLMEYMEAIHWLRIFQFNLLGLVLILCAVMWYRAKVAATFLEEWYRAHQILAIHLLTLAILLTNLWR